MTVLMHGVKLSNSEAIGEQHARVGAAVAAHLLSLQRGLVLTLRLTLHSPPPPDTGHEAGSGLPRDIPPPGGQPGHDSAVAFPSFFDSASCAFYGATNLSRGSAVPAIPWLSLNLSREGCP